ncbi:hypothetical protein PAECIP111802_03332 [Paenibacillus allorhizosphaerae]|uniref:Fibronectin type-III domain-containing protein n=2 Tax=Paenibacillus allorhizosphaerae TaxID=2849866 RepID=A0ABN7TKZ1_9BACL|nr:hypothetical protein PAECIP111802_03332 [Paenibacillus allorhizosphaerae]
MYLQMGGIPIFIKRFRMATCALLVMICCMLVSVFASAAEQPVSPPFSSGTMHTLAVSNGEVWAWGTNTYGQLGSGTTFGRGEPLKVAGMTNVRSVSTGFDHSLVLKNDGTVWAMGDNAYGQLGDGTNTRRLSPVQVQGLADVKAISTNQYRSFAVKNDGTVWAWGNNDYAFLGDGTTTHRWTPFQVQGLTGVSAISAGLYHTLALKEDGTLWAWGGGGNGQIGDGEGKNRLAPVQIPGIAGVKAFSAGRFHSLALKDDGTVWAWGYNTFGQLGDGTTTQSFTPVQIQGMTDVKALSGGGFSSLALKNDGTVWAWGINGAGQLGDGTTIQRNTPVQVQGLTGVTAISAGFSYSSALKSDGTMWAWGYNGYGQIGDATITNRLTPVKVKDFTIEFPDTTAPAWPIASSLTATEITETGARLNWTAATDNVGVAGYRIYQGESLQTAVTGNVYSVSALQPGTVYTFKVEAFDAAGNTSHDGPSVTFTTRPDVTAPVTAVKFAPILSPDGKYVTGLTATMTATDSGSGVSITKYRLNRSGSWVMYTSPLLLFAASTQTVEFYSIDHAGNQERTWLMDFNQGTLTQP